jgi:hypothetical protein
MSTQREAWDAVGDRFSGLTRRFKEKYEAREEATTPEEASEQLKGALRSIIDAIDGAATTLNEMARDPETREDARSTMLALRDALNTSFNELGDEVRKRVGSRPGDEGEPGAGPGEERDPVDED